MSETLSVNEKTWYLRIQGTRQGPYSSAQVRSLLLQETAGLQDEISQDGKRWLKLRDVPEVLPLQVRAELGDLGAQELIHVRELRQQAIENGNRRRFPLLALIIVLLMIVGIVGIALWKGMPAERDDPDCQAEASPGVNWRNCQLPEVNVGDASLVGANLNNAILYKADFTAIDLSAANLSYADLRHANMRYARLNQAIMVGVNLQGADLAEADMREADLRFADLTGSSLHGANLSGASLGEAIWVDGRICKRGSVGQCLRNP